MKAVLIFMATVYTMATYASSTIEKRISKDACEIDGDILTFGFFDPKPRGCGTVGGFLGPNTRYCPGGSECRCTTKGGKAVDPKKVVDDGSLFCKHQA
jgi:hypothetical protein